MAYVCTKVYAQTYAYLLSLWHTSKRHQKLTTIYCVLFLVSILNGRTSGRFSSLTYKPVVVLSCCCEWFIREKNSRKNMLSKKRRQRV